MTNPIYTVIEDNGGGLHLCILTNDSRDTCSHVFSGWERMATSNLTTSLAALRAGETDPADWEGAEADPQRIYDSLTDGETLRNGGARIIADEDGAIDAERMGVAGCEEFYPSAKEG